jgi:hypothetical protein
VRVRKGYFGSEGGESSQGTRGFHSHLVTARCQSSRHSRIPSRLVPWEGPARVRFAAHWWRSSGWSPRHSRIPLTSCLGGTGGSPVVVHRTQNSTTSVEAFSHPSRLVPREGPVRVRLQAHRRRSRQTIATVLHAASRHGTLASLKARASGGTGGSSVAAHWQWSRRTDATTLSHPSQG